MKAALALALLAAACATPAVEAAPAAKRINQESAPIDAGLAIDAPLDDSASPSPPPDAPTDGVVWLKGSTHVHAKPSGDATLPIRDVIHWYEQHGYDFIALTDHNRVSELDKQHDTRGQVAIDAPAHGLIVLAGIELTHNPVHCLPATDKQGRCRIHVNVLGATARPGGKLEWAERRSHLRLDMYTRALVTAKALGGIAQLNHPQWFWGMNAELLTELARRGALLVEIANAQFMTWAAGDATHPSMEQLWDAALGAGVTLWAIGSDDAHDYSGSKRAKWPAGGAWVMVHARRDPQAILDALAAGQFYASTGVVLSHAEPAGGELVVEVDAGDPGAHTIAFVENGQLVETVVGRSAHRTIPATGYVRAVVWRDADHARAWVQPARSTAVVPAPALAPAPIPAP